MAKSQTKQATNMADRLSANSTQQTMEGLFGGDRGAFGPTGLTPQYTKELSWQDQSRTMAMGATADLAKSGGVDPTTAATIADFEKTGGYSDAAKSRYMRQATSGVADTFRNLQQQQNQRNAATGGLGGGNFSNLGREMGQAQARATTSAAANLDAQISQNRLAGAGLGIDEAKQKQEGAKIAQAMYAEDTGALTATGQQILSMLGIDSSNQQAAMNAMVELSKRPGLFDNIMKGIATVVGAAAAYKGA